MKKKPSRMSVPIPSYWLMPIMAKIASMPKNQGIALAKDPEGQTYLTALNQLGKNQDVY